MLLNGEWCSSNLYFITYLYHFANSSKKTDRLDLKSWYDIHVSLYLEDWTLVCALWIFMSFFVLFENK